MHGGLADDRYIFSSKSSSPAKKKNPACSDTKHEKQTFMAYSRYPANDYFWSGCIFVSFQVVNEGAHRPRVSSAVSGHRRVAQLCTQR